MLTIDEFVGKLSNVKKISGGFLASCPAHEDDRQSLSVREGRVHPVLIRCHAGCPTLSVLDALGLTLADICAERPGQARSFASKPFVAPTPRPAAPKAKVVEEREVRVLEYPHRKVDGTLVATKLRFDLEQKMSDGTTRASKRFSWRRPNGMTGLNGTPITEMPLFASEVLAKAPEAVVVVVEGAKVAASLLSRGILSVATDGASVTPSAQVLECLRGRKVILCPDFDEPGEKHMDAMASALVGIAAAVKRVVWPEGTERGTDFADIEGGQIRALLAEAVPVVAEVAAA